MSRPSPILSRQLRALALGYRLEITPDLQWLLVRDVRLPPGYDRSTTEVLVQLPPDYPASPPGLNGGVFVRPDLRFRGRLLDSVHQTVTPGWGAWAWFCYQQIRWNPHRDNLISFMEMVRADLTDPPIQ